MSVRYAESNSAIDKALSLNDAGWTRDIPSGFIARVFPFRLAAEGGYSVDGEGPILVTPAEESSKGRGAPIFDAYHADPFGFGHEVGVSFKISREERNPRNAVLTTVKPTALAGVILGAQAGHMMPLWCYNQNPITGDWFRVRIDAAKVLREHPLVMTATWAKYPERAAEVRAALAPIGHVHIKGEEGAPKKPALVLSVAPRKSGKNPDGSPRIRLYFCTRINLAPLGVAWEPCDGPDLPKSFGDLEQGEMVG